MAAMVIGMPLGLIVGRSVWVRLANSFGTLAEPVLPLRDLLLGMAALLIMVGVLELVTVQRGLRRCPSELLQTE